ncbi:MAG: YsnF/AvaK domain-containing protein [Janthinobacterium lividum]
MNEVEKLALAQEETATQKIALIEERLQIDVRQVETGTVQIHKKVISEEVTQQVPVVSEEIIIEHKPINQYIENLPTVRVEGDTTIISVVKEVLVVEKRLLLVEEIHLTKTKIETTATITETLRKDVVEINRTDLTANNTTNQ